MTANLGPITLEKFLHRSYENERECEYVDGLLVERTGGDYPHARMHSTACGQLVEHATEWNIRCLMSYSMWTSPTRIRVPDLIVVNDRLNENIRKTPPLLCIEILAPEDTLLSLNHRCLDFLHMGIAETWLIDPIEQVAYTFTIAGLQLVKTQRLVLADSPVYLDLPELFAEFNS